MNFFKFMLILLGIGLGIWLLFWLFGIISAILWYLMWIGLIGLGGYVGYKMFLEKDDKPAQLEEKKPNAIAELQNLDRVLEEYKKKQIEK